MYCTVNGASHGHEILVFVRGISCVILEKVNCYSFVLLCHTIEVSFLTGSHHSNWPTRSQVISQYFERYCTVNGASHMYEILVVFVWGIPGVILEKINCYSFVLLCPTVIHLKWPLCHFIAIPIASSLSLVSELFHLNTQIEFWYAVTSPIFR